VPHAPGESDERESAAADDTAKVEMSLSSSPLLQDGQDGAAEPCTIFSKRFPHERHSYS
jgi:hypothetical protein